MVIIDVLSLNLGSPKKFPLSISFINQGIPHYLFAYFWADELHPRNKKIWGLISSHEDGIILHQRGY